MSPYARKVADLGFVVFVPVWGAGTRADAPTYDEPARSNPRLPARSSSPGRTRRVRRRPGHDGRLRPLGGRQHRALVAFARPEPTAGCLGGPTLGPIDALVTWEGDWVLETTYMGWDELLAADPRVMTALTPWTHLAEHKTSRS